MNITKKVISDLTLCYCVAPLIYQGKRHFLVASEKEFACLLFDEKGNQVDKIWDGPGGTMSAVQVPGSDGAFLATHRFYSPNNAKEASIVLVKPENGKWTIRTLVNLPHVHRFDILSRDGANYLLACCLKRDYETKDDWRFPGMTLACRLPDNLLDLPEGEMLTLTELKSDMLKNHGYCRSMKDGVMTGMVTCDSGVFRFIPPAAGENDWTIEELISDAASDAVDVDFDGDGEMEILTMSPFHGDTLRVYKNIAGKYQLVWEYGKKIKFVHAICRGKLEGRDVAIVGHRGDDRDLLAVSFEDGQYKTTLLDHDVGPANALFAEVDGKSVILSANREINEVAYYTVEE